jgi:hypothetical protein
LLWVVPAIILDVLAHAHEIAERLLARGRHADRGELTGPMKTCEVAGIDPVGLDAGTGTVRDHGRSDNVAGNAE